ncbi:MAG: Hint domain-containing protein [Pseudomonadota bacterium]
MRLGIYALPWAQVLIDGVPNRDPGRFPKGSVVSWHGVPQRIDGPPDVMSLSRSMAQSEIQSGLRRRAERRKATKNRAPDVEIASEDVPPEDAPLADLELSDGNRIFHCRIVPGLLVFEGELPMERTPLVVSRVGAIRRDWGADPHGAGLAAGTLIALADGGLVSIEMLKPGDWVATASGEPEQIAWVKSVMPTDDGAGDAAVADPVRIRAGALGHDLPKQDLRVAAGHRIQIPGDHTVTCEPFVFVRAGHLDLPAVRRDPKAERERYIELGFRSHVVIFANGLPCEAFDPDLEAGDEAALPIPPAHRTLSRSDTALVAFALRNG